MNPRRSTKGGIDAVEELRDAVWPSSRVGVEECHLNAFILLRGRDRRFARHGRCSPRQGKVWDVDAVGAVLTGGRIRGRLTFTDHLGEACSPLVSRPANSKNTTQRPQQRLLTQPEQAERWFLIERRTRMTSCPCPHGFSGLHPVDPQSIIRTSPPLLAVRLCRTIEETRQSSEYWSGFQNE